MHCAIKQQFPFSASGPAIVDRQSSRMYQPAGVSTAWRKLLLQIEMAAPYVQVASVEGEAGVGKQTLGRYLWSRSPLAGVEFRRRDAREWLINEADPASITGFTYLDRVDLLAPPGQSLLLSVLKVIQDRPAGRVMLVASSQTPLRQMAGQGLLMPDLAFRLTAARFAIPPLRMRKEDIPPLAQAVLEDICSRYKQRRVELGQGALARLLQHSWPGNVRELASVLEAGLLESADGVIGPSDLTIARVGSVPLEPGSPVATQNLALEYVTRRHVQYVLDLNQGNKLRAAQQLGISRSTLYRILSNEGALVP